MEPRITISFTDDGQIEMWLNPAGRDALVAALQALNENHEHLHLSPDTWSDLQLSTRAYRPTDHIVEYGKVLFRTDEWDQQRYPQVMEPSGEQEA